ncbi:MAG: sensor histidine kinase N-terminal domain-containing protein [Burkholderiaceae bacterium]
MSDTDRLETPVSSTATTETPAPQPEVNIQRSLFGEILDWILVPLLLLWPVSIAITYVVAKSIANQPFDRALDDNVTVLAQQVKEVSGKTVTTIPGSAREFLRADEIDSVYFEITGPRGEYVEGDRDIPIPVEEEKPQPDTVQFRDEVIHGAAVRIAYTYIDLRKTHTAQGTSTEPRLALVQIAETLGKRTQLANEIIKGVILPQFIILPVALALIWLALARGLSPLSELQNRIRGRRSDDLSPIEVGHVPEEITPLVHSLNDMLERLSQTIQMQKRFIADAAHQMKTPLAGMRMQSELALQQNSAEEIHKSLLQLAKSSGAATRLVNQLLALARAENQTPQTKPFVPLELGELARSAVHDFVQLSFARKIDLGFEQPGYPVTVIGDPLTLRELLNNLIDNALHYTPAKGSITVRVRADEDKQFAYLEVEDTGPGIPVAERSHVFERFYRILGTDVEGSGLGLAIVREIAQQHGADIDIFNNPRSHDPKFPGSLFRVTLRMQQRSTFIEDID